MILYNGKLTKEDKEKIVELYISGSIFTKDIARQFNVSPRSVQRLVKKEGVSLSRADRIRQIVHLKDYSFLRIPPEKRKHRKSLRPGLRLELISAQPWCSLCGGRPPDVALEVDHVNEDPSDNRPENLQVLCRDCNRGKASKTSPLTNDKSSP